MGTEILIVAALSASIWETLKTLYVSKDGIQVNKLGAMLVGVLIAINFNIDMFSLMGITGAAPIVNKILTGILIGNGSNFIYDLVHTINSFGEKSDEDIK